MNDDIRCDELAAIILEEHNAALIKDGMRAGPMVARLGDVFKTLRSRGVNWQRILQMVGPILAILAGGGSWTTVLQAILAMFFPPSPTPTPPAPAA